MTIQTLVDEVKRLSRAEQLEFYDVLGELIGPPDTDDLSLTPRGTDACLQESSHDRAVPDRRGDEALAGGAG